MRVSTVTAEPERAKTIAEIARRAEGTIHEDLLDLVVDGHSPTHQLVVQEKLHNYRLFLRTVSNLLRAYHRSANDSVSNLKA